MEKNLDLNYFLNKTVMDLNCLKKLMLETDKKDLDYIEMKK